MTSIIKFIIILVSFAVIQCNPCDKISVNAITNLYNKTIVIFERENVWFFDREQQLSGPCPLSLVYKDGLVESVDAAVTINDHQLIADFIGSGVYFVNDKYYTYKNLNPYVVEWGSLVYLPHKGELRKVAEQSTEAQSVVKKSKLIAAYYDPTDNHTKLVFTDETILSFGFEFGIEYESPVITNLTYELKRFNVDSNLTTITAAFTLKTGRTSKLYLFSNNNFCEIDMNAYKHQKCVPKHINEFIECDKITTNTCPISQQSADKPIDVSANKDNKNKGEGIKILSKSDEQTQVKDNKTTDGTNVGKNSSTNVLQYFSLLLIYLLSLFIINM